MCGYWMSDLGHGHGHLHAVSGWRLLSIQQGRLALSLRGTASTPLIGCPLPFRASAVKGNGQPSS